MSRPFTDIAVIDPNRGINNKSAVCSTTRTGESAILVVRPNYPVSLTIQNIQNKFGYRFYNGIFVQLAGDQVIVGG